MSEAGNVLNESSAVPPARLLVIMPAHNEAQNLPRVINELRAVLTDADILVVDDRSTDDTAAVAARLGAKVVSLPCNLGYGGAVQTGFRYATERGYAFGLLMDADGQHDPGSAPRLLAAVISGETDVALGSRFLGETTYHVPVMRRWGMAFFRAIVAWMSKQRFTDPTSGFQAHSHDVMRFFARDNYPTDYPDADTILLLKYAGFRVREVPVTVHARLSGRSMHAGWKPLYYIFKMLLSILMVGLRQKTNRTASVRRP